MLIQYINEIYSQILSFGKQASIKIQGVNKKTVRIKLPEWKSSDSTCELKVRDFINTCIKECIVSRDDRPFENKIESKFSIVKLFDTLIGIDSIKIDVLKVEMERELYVPWRDVLKNSGGEGFLSIFFFLSAFLHYMHHTDDIKLNERDGKVLVMDNPFGKISAKHLLTPAMEIAKKNNIQLICFTPIGMETIHDCFDNIYVMNIVSNKESKTSFVCGEQVKRTHASHLASAHIHVKNLSLF